jgi:hypothetical protein
MILRSDYETKAEYTGSSISEAGKGYGRELVLRHSSFTICWKPVPNNASTSVAAQAMFWSQVGA